MRHTAHSSASNAQADRVGHRIVWQLDHGHHKQGTWHLESETDEVLQVHIAQPLEQIAIERGS